MNERYDGDDRESRTAFRAYDTLSEPVSGRTPWQIWRDACAWQASRATPADQDALDAQRYRWLQRQGSKVWYQVAQMRMNETGEFIDSAIAADAAKGN